MTRRAAVTCDQCGTMQDTPAGDAAFGILPRGWISAAYDPPLDAPQPQVKQHADLCSWLCAAAYAAERAGMALAQADSDGTARETLMAGLAANPAYQAALHDAESESWDGPGIDGSAMIEAADERRRA